MKKYKHFIFDFDGVISNSTDIAIKKYNDIRNSEFPKLPLMKNRQDFTVVYSGLLKKSLNRWIGENGTKDFFNMHSKAMRESSKYIFPYDGIVQVLNSLGKSNYSIVTSSYSEAVESILKKDASFNSSNLYRIAGRELMQSKTEKIKNILKDLGISNIEAIYIGDLESDIIYCKDVPIDIISVGYGYHPYEYLIDKGANHTVKTIKELSELIKKINHND